MKRVLPVLLGIAAVAFVLASLQPRGRSRLSSDRTGSERGGSPDSREAEPAPPPGPGDEASTALPSSREAVSLPLTGPESLRSPPEERVVLRGRVVDRLSRSPVAGARVLAYRERDAARGAGGFHRPGLVGVIDDAEEDGEEEGSRALASALSDPEGRFEFRDVALGERRLGLSVVSEWHYMTEAVLAASGGEEEIVLEAKRGGRITGWVFGPDGRPASGARITVTSALDLARMLSPLGEGLLVRRSEAREDGSFAVGGLPPARSYDVAASGKDVTPVRRSSDAVEENRETEVELRAVPGGSVAGRVVDPTGKPVPGAQVRAASSDSPNEFFPAPPPPVYETASGPDGRFLLENVRPGRVRVVASTDTLGPMQALDGRASLEEGRRREVEVGAGKTAGPLEIVLHPAAVIAGVVLGPDGRRIPDAEVSVSGWMSQELRSPGGGGGQTMQRRRARTGEDGGFRFPGLPGPGRFHVTALKEPFAPAEAADVGPLKSDLRLVLQTAGGVAGTVVDGARGEPVRAFMVAAIPEPEVSEVADGPKTGQEEDLPGPPFIWSQAAGDVRSRRERFDDPRGKFLLEGLAADSYLIVVQAEGYLPNKVRSVEVVAGEVRRGVIVALESASSIAGRVVGPGGPPTAGALVFAVRVEKEDSPPSLLSEILDEGLGPDRSAPTGSDGSFLVRNLRSGTYDLVALAEGSARGFAKAIPVGRSETRDGVEIRLRAAGSIGGVVADPEGRPLGGREVAAFSLGVGAGGQARSGADGTYDIRGLEPGSYFVLLATGGGEEVPMLAERGQVSTASVREGERTRLDLVDDSVGGCRVFGVARAAGKPLANGTVVATRGTGDALPLVPTAIDSARTDGEGRYEFSSLAPGRYMFQFGEGTGTGVVEEGPRQEAEVPEAEEFRLDLELAPTTVAGKVVDAQKASVVLEGQVGLIRAGHERSEVSGGVSLTGIRAIGMGGAFRYENVAPGEYVLLAWGRPAGGGEEGVAYAPTRVEGIKVEVGRPARDLVVRVERGASLLVTVLGPSGEPVGEGVIELETEDAPLPFESRKRLSGGTVAFRGELAPGSYGAVVRAPGLATERLDGIGVARGAVVERTVRLVEGTPLSVTLLGGRGERAAEAFFEVLDASGRRLTPKGSAALRERLYGFGAEDADHLGNPDLVGRFAPGTYRVRAIRGGKEVASATVELSGRDPQTVTLREK